MYCDRNDVIRHSSHNRTKSRAYNSLRYTDRSSWTIRKLRIDSPIKTPFEFLDIDNCSSERSLFKKAPISRRKTQFWELQSFLQSSLLPSLLTYIQRHLSYPSGYHSNTLAQLHNQQDQLALNKKKKSEAN